MEQRRDRRGSGYSLVLNGQRGNIFLSIPLRWCVLLLGALGERASMYGGGGSVYSGPGAYGGYGAYPPPPAVAPCYVQSPQYPVLLNPQYMPPYQYGVPSQPVAAAAMGTQYPGMRRAGSINAKIMSQVRE